MVIKLETRFKRLITFFIIFMCLLGVGSMLSNVQSREADQLLEAHGLSNNTRYIEVNCNETISDFLRYLDKYKNAFYDSFKWPSLMKFSSLPLPL